MKNHKRLILIEALEQYKESCTKDEIAEMRLTEDLINEFKLKDCFAMKKSKLIELLDPLDLDEKLISIEITGEKSCKFRVLED